MDKNQYLGLIATQYGGNPADYANLLDLALIACADYGITAKERRDKIPGNNLYELPANFFKVLWLKTVSNIDISFEIVEINKIQHLKFLGFKIPSCYNLISEYDKYISISNINTTEFILRYSYLSETVDDFFRMAVDAYVEYLILNRKITQMLVNNDFSERVTSLAESDGNINQTITFGSNNDLVNSYKTEMLVALDRFLNIASIPFLDRG